MFIYRYISLNMWLHHIDNLCYIIRSISYTDIEASIWAKNLIILYKKFFDDKFDDSFIQNTAKITIATIAR